MESPNPILFSTQQQQRLSRLVHDYSLLGEKVNLFIKFIYVLFEVFASHLLFSSVRSEHIKSF